MASVVMHEGNVPPPYGRSRSGTPLRSIPVGGGGRSSRTAACVPTAGAEVAGAAPPGTGATGTSALHPRGDPGADQLVKERLQGGDLIRVQVGDRGLDDPFPCPPAPRR